MNNTRQMPERLQQMRRVDTICQRFERAWKDGAEPDIVEELAAADPADRADLLTELLPLEWVYRRSRGHAFGRDDYRSRFPELTSVVDRVWEHWQEVVECR